MSRLSVVVLAAGRGLRMGSTLPKLLHPIGGVSLLGRLLSTVRQLNPQQILVVIGHQGEQLKNAFANQTDIDWVLQEQQLGTGHAVLQALPKIKAIEKVLILNGDGPLITVDTLNRFLQTVQEKAVGLITVNRIDPTGLGRIVRDKQGKVLRIVEEKVATAEEKHIQEINAGFYVVPKKGLQEWLPKIKANNPQQEYFLPDIIPMAAKEGFAITTLFPNHDWEALGINDKIQLAELERIFQREQARRLMQAGVTLFDPARFDVRGEVSVGKDVVIDINVVLEGRVILGNNVSIGSNVYIKDATIQEGTHILSNSIIEDATIGGGCSIGPFARIRPGTVLSENAHVGNFVEIKNSSIGTSSKINHLSYIGDASVGKHVNVGAGTITCNFDGEKKYRTIIGDRVFIGSDTQLIAPVTVGEGVTIGAGTTVTRDIPANHLVHNKIEHRSVANWVKPEADEELE